MMKSEEEAEAASAGTMQSGSFGKAVEEWKKQEGWQ
jgi:hypothetical protein